MTQEARNEQLASNNVFFIPSQGNRHTNGQATRVLKGLDFREKHLDQLGGLSDFGTVKLATHQRSEKATTKA